MILHIQREKSGSWRNVVTLSFADETTGEYQLRMSKTCANELDVGTQPEALRIIEDGTDLVVGWVSRNGYMPGGALAP